MSSLSGFTGLPASLSASNISTASTAPASASAQVSPDQFLQLMVSQLQNQDPSQPMDTGTFLTQMAQISSSQGINKLQSSFSSLATSLQSNQALQASTMVGRQVMIESSTVQTDGTNPTSFGLELPAEAGAVQVSITDASGQLVRQLSLGPTAAGTAHVSWDGKNANGTQVPAGGYTMTAAGIIAGQAQSLTTCALAPVESVSMSGNGVAPQLNLTNYGTVGLGAVKEVF